MLMRYVLYGGIDVIFVLSDGNGSQASVHDAKNRPFLVHLSLDIPIHRSKTADCVLSCMSGDNVLCVGQEIHSVSDCKRMVPSAWVGLSSYAPCCIVYHGGIP
jgi:hypothetical protein